MARWLAAGALAGIFGGFALALVARIAMRGFVLGIDGRPEFTIPGTVAIALFAALGGAAFGLVYLGIRRVLPGPPLVKGVVYGVLLIVLVQLPAFATGLEEARPAPALGFVLFLPVTLAFGIAIALAHELFHRRFADTESPAADALAAIAILVAGLGALLVAPLLLDTYAKVATRLLG